MTVMRNSAKGLWDRLENMKYKKQIFLISVSLSFVVLVSLLISSLFVALRLTSVLRDGRNRLLMDRKFEVVSLPGDEENIEYAYNRDVINILLIGVDKTSDKDQEAATEQADALYLFAFDTVKKQVHVIAISRNTLMSVDIYDMNHKLVARDEQQICTAYAYGRTRKESAELTVDAVSRFFYNIPISGYYVVYMDAVGEIVDSVGGVSVEIDEDMTIISPDWRKGTNVLLKGEKVVRYLRFRQESNEPRLDRQKVFLQKFLSVAKQMTSKDLSLPVKIFQQLASKTVTNVDASSVAYIASEAVQADIVLRGLKGEVGSDGFFETFTVDQDDLHQLLTDVFYKINN